MPSQKKVTLECILVKAQITLGLRCVGNGESGIFVVVCQNKVLISGGSEGSKMFCWDVQKQSWPLLFPAIRNLLAVKIRVRFKSKEQPVGDPLQNEIASPMTQLNLMSQGVKNSLDQISPLSVLSAKPRVIGLTSSCKMPSLPLTHPGLKLWVLANELQRGHPVCDYARQDINPSQLLPASLHTSELLQSVFTWGKQS